MVEQGKIHRPDAICRGKDRFDGVAEKVGLLSRFKDLNRGII